jgi:hypothetical protein
MASMRKLLLLVRVALAALPLIAQTPKLPWEWSDAERIAALTDDAAAAARLRIYRASQPQAVTYNVDGTASDPNATVYDRIDGSRDPHLFFPFELFDSLVRMSYADEFITRRASRERVAGDLEAIGLPADFWDSLELISTAYRTDRKDAEHYRLSRRPEAEKHAALDVIYKRMCHDRRAAMREAQERFGPKFNQFLYAAIAPTMTSLVLHKPDAEEMRRFLAGEYK